MKKIILFTFIIVSALTASGQKKPIPEPLIIKGQLTNYPEKTLIVGFDNGNGLGLYIYDTTNVDKDGKFYLKTFKIKRPQLVNMGYYKTTISDIAVAPGYNLTITADCKDYNSIVKSVKIQGIGAAANQYNIILNATLIEQKNIHDWYELPDKDMLNFVERDRKLRDSVTHLVFNKKPAQDKYFNHFKKIAHLDNAFYDMYYLIAHVYDNIFSKKYNYEKSVAFINNNVDQHILKNISNNEYLIARNYKMFLSIHLRYLTSLDYLKDSTLRNRKYYALEKASKLYTGKAREYVLYNLIISSNQVPSIIHAGSFNDLSKRMERLKPYITKFSDPLKKDIEVKLSEKNAELVRTATGRAAPAFTLQSNLGKPYSLGAFKGKAVFIDLWASWCHPCREETPYLKNLYNKYKNDDRIAFISIAVWDVMKEWKKALQEDKPGWLQLIDKDDLVVNAYGTHGIPKFILIDKQGNIALLDTPLPSAGKKLEDVLLTEMAK